MLIIMHIIAYHKHNIFIATVHFDAILVHSGVYIHCCIHHCGGGVLHRDKLAGWLDG